MRRRRRALDLTQAELAERVACAEVTIRKIESDSRRPSRQMAEILADALVIEPDARALFIGAARALISPTRLAWPMRDSGLDGGTVADPLTSFVGRGSELNDLVDLAFFAGGPARLISITGPPGVGKTRLAQELAMRSRRVFDVADVFVELAYVTEAPKVWDRIASAVVIPAGGGVDRIKAAVAALGRGPTLLVLDNFEQVLDAAPEVTALLRRCPELTCLVTSRTRLDVYGEHEYPLEPLAVPPAAVVPTPDRLHEWPGLDLFVQRAAAARPGYSLDADLVHVAEICRGLDGLPLAIELAALRTRRMSVDVLSTQLAEDVGMLGASTRDRDARQRSVMGAVRWSYNLLAPEARRALSAASVFESTFDRASLYAVAALDPAQGSAALDELVDHALVRTDPTGSRYSLLNIIRAFGTRRLDEEGACEGTRRRHAEYYVVQVERAVAGVEAWSSGAPFEAIDREIDNIVAALTWAFGAGGDPELGRRLAAATGIYWPLASRVLEGAYWSKQAFESATKPTDQVAPAYFWAECVASQGDLAGAMRLLEQAEILARRVGDTRWLPLILGTRGMLLIVTGDIDGAAAALDESLSVSEATGTRQTLALARLRTSRLEYERGRIDESDVQASLALDLFRRTGDPWGIGTALGNRGDNAVALGQIDGALDAYMESVNVYADAGFDWFAASRVESIGNVLASAGSMKAAATTYGLADQWLADISMAPNPITGPARGDHEPAVRAALGSSFARFAHEGSAIPRTIDAVRGLCRREQMERDLALSARQPGD